MSTLTKLPFSTIRQNADEIGSSVYFGENDDWLIIYAVHRDSDLLAQSNFDCIRQSLLELPAVKEWQGDDCPVSVERFSHWAVGWIDYLILDPSCQPAIDLAVELRERLENYPILDESDFSDREWQQMEEDWKDYGRSDYRKALVKALFVTEFEPGYFEPFTDAEASEACEELDKLTLDELQHESANKCSQAWYSEGQGTVFCTKDLVKHTDADALGKAIFEVLQASQRLSDMQKLGKLLGATDAQIAQAVSLQISTVTEFRNLIASEVISI